MSQRSAFKNNVVRSAANGAWGLLALSLALNVIQSQRLRMLPVASQDPAEVRTAPPLRFTIAQGPALALIDSQDGRPAILYYFSATCGWCDRNWPGVAALERATRSRYRFLALAAVGEDVGQVADQHPLEFELHAALDRSHREALGLSATPHTLVIGADGRILKSWLGAFRGRVILDVERYFGVALREAFPPDGHGEPRRWGVAAPLSAIAGPRGPVPPGALVGEVLE